MTCPTLTSAIRETVNFDPSNPEHRKAFKMLVLGEVSEQTGAITLRQHPTLRFTLPAPYTNVRQMLIHRACEEFIQS